MKHAERGRRNGEQKWIVLAAMLAAASPASAQTSLSIYADGRVVVRKTVPQPLERGRNTVTVVLDDLRTATLFSPDSLVTIVSGSVRSATTKERALELAIGQRLAFVRARGDTVWATVVSVSPPQYRLADGRMLLRGPEEYEGSDAGWPGEPLFPATLVRSMTEASLVVDATRPRPRTELAFVTGGATWQAVYQAVLGRTEAVVTGAATITSESLRSDSAEVQLVAGSVARAPGRGIAGVLNLEAVVVERQQQRAAEPEYAPEQAVGETHVYGLPGRLTIAPGTATMVALFPRARARYMQELVVPGVLPWRGWIGQTPEPNRVPVQVWYNVRRERGTPFGERPLPGGIVQIYQPDSAGRAQLLGEARADHLAPGRDLRVQSGDAFDVTAERVQTDFIQEQLPPPRRGVPGRQRVTAAYRVTITNAKTEAVTVDVREARYGMWRIVESSTPAEKLSATEYRFRVPLPAGVEAVLTYTVQLES